MKHLTWKRKTTKSTKLSDRGDIKVTIQRYRIWKNKAKISSMKLSTSSKHLRFLSFHTPKNAYWHHLPNLSTPRPSIFSPIGKQVDNSSRHNPRQIKLSEERITQNGSHVPVKKKVVHWFHISLAQVASIHYDIMPLPKIIHDKDIA